MPDSKQKFSKMFFVLAILSIILAGIYLFGNLPAETWDYNIPRRINVLLAIFAVAAAVGLSSVTFQTITSNYILTPSIMGLDNLYVFIQTLIICFLGAGVTDTIIGQTEFLITLAVMIFASAGIFLFMFKLNSGDVFSVVLSGLVFGAAFGGLSNFMQVIIDPSEFSILEGRMFASFNRINLPLLGISSLIIIGVFFWISQDFKSLDAVTLGKNYSIALGVRYHKIVLKTLVAVSLLTSASTALVGPVTFLGILTVSIARFAFPTYRHAILVPGSVLTGVCILISGIIATERILEFSVPLSAIINFIGGICFICLVLKLKRV